MSSIVRAILRKLVRRAGYELTRLPLSPEELEAVYHKHGERPWDIGYLQARAHLLEQVLGDAELMRCFRQGERLPSGYGVGFDERCVEYPWMLSRLSSSATRILDAGSTLNYREILLLPDLRTRKIHIQTIFPESRNHQDLGISYIYEDLRDIPMRDAFYDAIICLSTLEHIGLDNSIYTGNAQYREHKQDDFLYAVKELCRVLKPSGEMFITVPFGAYQDLGFQQQFDTDLLDRLLTSLHPSGLTKLSFYLYAQEGWQVATRQACTGASYVEWIANVWQSNIWPTPLPLEADRAAAARAVACIHLTATGNA